MADEWFGRSTLRPAGRKLLPLGVHRWPNGVNGLDPLVNTDPHRRQLLKQHAQVKTCIVVAVGEPVQSLCVW